MRTMPYGLAVCLLGLLAAADAARPDTRPAPEAPQQTPARPDSLPTCRGFDFPTDTTIVAQPTGNLVTIRGAHEIRFDPGAVTQPTTFVVSKAGLWNQGRQVAGFVIAPRQGGGFQFQAPVLLKLSYAACEPGVGQARRRRVARVPVQGGNPNLARAELIGGADSTVGKYVAVLVDHFTGFVVAM